jgi:hypothetical protein
MYEWILESILNKSFKAVTYLIAGFFLQYFLSVHFSQTLTFAKVIANTTLIWLSLRLIVLLKKNSEE